MAGRIATVILTVVVILLAFVPAAQGYIVEVASIGYGILMQLVPSVIGAFYWKRGSRQAALASIISGEIVMMIVKLFGSPFPMRFGVSGLIVATIVYIAVSMVTTDDKETAAVKDSFHADFDRIYSFKKQA